MKTLTTAKPLGIFARAVRSTTRHPLRTLLLFVLVAAISCLICAGGAMLSASIKTQSEGQNALPATYRLELDIGSLRERLAALPPEYSFQAENGAWGTDIPNNAIESVLIKDAEKLAQVDGVGRYSVESVAVPSLLVGLDRIEDERRDQTGDFGGVNVVGMLEGELNSNIAAGNIVLTQGAWITKGDSDALVVSQQFAELNGLTIGDTVTLTDAKNNTNVTEVSAPIKGIFEIVHEIPSNMSGDTFRSENTFFSNLAFSQKITGSEDDPLYASATFEVEDPNHYSEIGNTLHDAGIDWSRYTLIDDSGKTERMSQNFEGLSSVTYVFMIVVATCGLLLVMLSLAFWAKNRKHEIAILLSLGCSRSALVGQVLLEACTIALVGCLAAALIAEPAANTFVAVIAADQIEQTATEADTDAARTAGASNLDAGSFQEAKATITWQIIITAMIAVELMVILAVLATIAPIAHKRPRTVLAELE